MARFLGVKPKKRLSRVKKQIQNGVRKQFAEQIKKRLEEVTDPFQTDFEFIIEETERDGDLFFEILPADVDIPRQRKDGGFVNARILFSVLNDGSTNQVFVSYPDDFELESSPNSLSTSSAGYDRGQIYVDKNRSGTNTDARNWTILISKEFDSTKKAKITSILKGAIKGFFN